MRAIETLKNRVSSKIDGVLAAVKEVREQGGRGTYPWRGRWQQLPHWKTLDDRK